MQPAAPRLSRSRLRLWLGGLACAALITIFSGCQSVGFYRQAIGGQCEILTHGKSIDKLIAEPQTPPLLKNKFELILQIRQFAADQLKLPPGKSYLNYVDLHRSNVVWNVNVCPALSLEPFTWWYPFVGRASYRGYFSEGDALHYAARFDTNQWDVYVDGIETYSTLGWFKDPLLNTFIDEPDDYLAEIIFHELTHRRLFVPGDTDFNEAFATFVSSEGVRRWYLASNHPQGYDKYKKSLDREHQFVDLVTAARGRLQAIYTDPKFSVTEKMANKKEIIADLRADYARLKMSWGGGFGYDDWFASPINNAKLNTVSAYFDLVPAFAALLQANGGDLEKFYGAVAALGKLPIEARHRELDAYVHTRGAGGGRGDFKT